MWFNSPKDRSSKVRVNRLETVAGRGLGDLVVCIKLLGPESGDNVSAGAAPFFAFMRPPVRQVHKQNRP
jgi:hypothetical protein